MAQQEILVSSDILNATSEVWVRKMYTWFNVFDTERKGFFCKEEWEKIFTEKAENYFNGEELAVATTVGVHMWDNIFGRSGIASGGQTIVTWPDFLEYRFDLQQDAGNKEVIDDFRTLAIEYFGVTDKDKDGILSIEELVQVGYLYGLSKYAAKLLGVTCDKECSGNVSVDAYHATWFSYFFTTEWDESTSALGPLDNAKICCNASESIRYAARVPADITDDMGELWVRKMLTVFRHYDVDATGSVTFQDMTRVVRKRLENRTSPSDMNGLMDLLKTYWDLLYAKAAKDGILKWVDFLRLRYEGATTGRSEEEPKLKEFSDNIISTTDVNKDQQLQLVEYLPIGALRGLTRHQTVLMFSSLDENDDGSISREESSEGWKMFMYSKEYDNGTLLYGTLNNAKIVIV